MTDATNSRHFYPLPRLKIMPQKRVRELLQEFGGQEDLSVQADTTVKEYIDTKVCPECSSKLIPFVNPNNPFTEGKLTPNFLCRCASCGCEVEPYTGVILKVGQRNSYSGDPDRAYSRLIV